MSFAHETRNTRRNFIIPQLKKSYLSNAMHSYVPFNKFIYIDLIAT